MPVAEDAARLRPPSSFVRFAVVGVCNTAIDVALFLVLHEPLGLLVANLCSTSAGMTFSFVVNGRYTFRTRRFTARQGVLFVLTTGTILWLVQPALVHGLLWLLDPGTPFALLIAKLAALGTCVLLTFTAYRYVVWPAR